jgi:drug/metabolite transporter (DMT)-like permease
MDSNERHWHGVALLLASGVAFSTADLFTRVIAADAWTMLFWRGVFGGLFIGGYVVWQQRRGTLAAIRAIGPVGLVVAACSALATICFINAFRRTTVADVSLTYAALPFVTASIGLLLRGERETWATLVASAVAFSGIAVMFGAALSLGHIDGDLLALAMTVIMAVMMVLIRRHRDTPMLPAASLSAFASALLVLPLARPASPEAIDFFYLALFGTTQFGLGLLLLTLGTRLISATRSALIGNLEVPLAPIWVWLAFGEVPAVMTCVGGGLVMLAVVGEIALGRRAPTLSGKSCPASLPPPRPTCGR